jgi:mannitol-specific phosphotransferase system IIBC component
LHGTSNGEAKEKFSMLTFLMVAMIVFFVTSGVFLSIEARKRNQMEAARGLGSASQANTSQSAAKSTSKAEVPKAA